MNHLTSSGLDLALALNTLFIFFAFTLDNILPSNWWENTIVSATMDVQDTVMRSILVPLCGIGGRPVFDK